MGFHRLIKDFLEEMKKKGHEGIDFSYVVPENRKIHAGALICKYGIPSYPLASITETGSNGSMHFVVNLEIIGKQTENLIERLEGVEKGSEEFKLTERELSQSLNIFSDLSLIVDELNPNYPIILVKSYDKKKIDDYITNNSEV